MPTTWDNYMPEVAPDVAGCPKSVIRNAIRNSAIELCYEGRAWRTQITDVTMVIGTPVYTLGVPVDSEVIATTRLLVVGDVRPLSTLPPAHQNRFKISADNGRPKFYNAETPATVTLYPPPDTAYVAEVFALLKPTKVSLGGPDFLYNDWLEVIASGAKARLMAMAGRPWSNPKMVNIHRKAFVKGYVEARIRDAKGNVESSSYARPATFGHYRGRKV